MGRYTSFRRELQQTLRCLEHEAFDHPVAMLIVVSSGDADPIACFQELQSPHHLPPPFHNVSGVLCLAPCWLGSRSTFVVAAGEGAGGAGAGSWGM